MKAEFAKFKRWMKFNPPAAESIDGWKDHADDFKSSAPVRYFLSKTLPEAISDFTNPIKHRFIKSKDWIRYRTYDKYHVIDTGLKPGYYDKCESMLHVNFNMLVEFVEVEKAWMQHICSDDSKNLNWWQSHKFRNVELGLKYLDWEATLDDPNLPPGERSVHQAVAAREIKELYLWWTVGRPNRDEDNFPSMRRSLEEYAREEYGFMYSISDRFRTRFPKSNQRYKDKMNQLHQTEEDWKKEDEEMLVKLVKLRQTLWT